MGQEDVFRIIKDANGKGITSKDIQDALLKGDLLQKIEPIDVGKFTIMRKCRQLWNHRRICRKKIKNSKGMAYKTYDKKPKNVEIVNYKNGRGNVEIVERDLKGWEYALTRKDYKRIAIEKNINLNENKVWNKMMNNKAQMPIKSIAMFSVVLLVAAGVLYGLQSGFFNKTKEVETVLRSPRIQYNIGVQNESGGFLPANVYAYTDGKFRTQVVLSGGVPNAFLLDQNHTYAWVVTNDGYYNQKHILVANIGNIEKNNSRVCKYQGQDFYCDKEIITLHKFPTDLNVNLLPKLDRNVENYILTFKTSNELRRPTLCFKWSFDIADMQMNLTIGKIPVRLNQKYFDKCYSMKSVYNQEVNQTLTIKTIQTPLGKPHKLIMTVIDENTIPDLTSPDWKFSQENIGQDVGYQDVEIVFEEQNH